MTKNSLLSAFNYTTKAGSSIQSLVDYDIFKDKELLDKYRKEIIENLIDKNVSISDNLNDFINDEITNVTVGSDLSNLERSYLFNLIDSEINGFGPLTSLLEDNNISEIMVNAPDEVFIESDGIVSKDDSVSFINNDHILRTLQKLIKDTGKTIDSNNPIIDVRLKDGIRINAVIPPLSLYPTLTIKKFISNVNTVDDLIRTGTCTTDMARFIEACVLSKLNILICGSVGSGKTILLKILSDLVPDNERIITIEESRELNLSKSNVVSLESQNRNLKDLLITSLNMRPDRIIIGEVKGKEAFDYIQAMNTGYNGIISTIYANGVLDALKRLETLLLMEDMQIPVKTIREYIGSAVDIVINIEKLPDGKKKITNICEINGVNKDNFEIKNIFSFNQKSIMENGEIDGEYVRHEGDFKSVKLISKIGIADTEDIFR